MLKKNTVKRTKEEIIKTIKKKIDFMTNEIKEELNEESKNKVENKKNLNK